MGQVDGAYKKFSKNLPHLPHLPHLPRPNPNPPKDTEGRREDRGRGGYRGDGLGSIGVDGRSADALQPPHRAPMAACESWDARDGERICSRELSRTGMTRV